MSNGMVGKAGVQRLDETVVHDLRTKVRGELIQPGDPQYESARKVYNGMIDRYPGLIARCVDVADVIACRESCPGKQGSAGHPRRRAQWARAGHV